MSRFFSCPYLGATVELTQEREQHIILNHPGTLPDYLEQLAMTLEIPDYVRRSDRVLQPISFLSGLIQSVQDVIWLL